MLLLYLHLLLRQQLLLLLLFSLPTRFRRRLPRSRWRLYQVRRLLRMLLNRRHSTGGWHIVGWHHHMLLSRRTQLPLGFWTCLAERHGYCLALENRCLDVRHWTWLTQRDWTGLAQKHWTWLPLRHRTALSPRQWTDLGLSLGLGSGACLAKREGIPLG